MHERRVSICYEMESQEWPLVYVDGELAAIPGLCVAEKFLADDGEPGNWLAWEPASAMASC